MADGTTRRCFSFDDPDGLPEPFVRDLGTLSSQTKVGHLAAALDLLMREVGFVVGSVPSFATGLSQEYSLETAKSCCAHLQVVTVLSKAVVLGNQPILLKPSRVVHGKLYEPREQKGP